MWLATKHGFYSIIEKAQGTFHVRARVRQDLENLLVATGLEPRVECRPRANYRYRIIVGPEDLLKVMVLLTATVDYPHFQDSIAARADQRPKLECYQRMWAQLGDLEEVEVCG